MNVNYTHLLEEINFYLAGGRTESAAFLMWYLEKYYRLDKQEAIDSVCDNNGDKGVDGIYINESLGTIDIFQSKISQSTNKSIGDTSLKEFNGTLSQFQSREKVEKLLLSAGKAEVAALIKRLNLVERIDEYPVRGIFLANVDLSSDGKDYLDSNEDIDFVGKSMLESEYISDSKEINIQAEATFDISSNETTTYLVDASTQTYIAPIKSTELVQLKGIDDQSIFDYNVRGSLGNTKINKGIVRSIRDRSLHKKFPLFHNGITIVAEQVKKEEDKIILKKFYVVNGCQSLTSLFRNQSYLTEDLKILTKIIRVPINSSLSSQITEYSNSQNGVKPRDFKSFNQIQIRLQNEIKQKFPDQFFFEIKRGEINIGQGETISNEISGIYLMSFDIKEPWNTHRKYQVFEDAYNKLFARPEVTAERIVFLHVLGKLVDGKMMDIENQLIARYSLTKYAIIYMIRTILEKDVVGKKLIQDPSKYVEKENNIIALSKALNVIINDIIIDLNAEVRDLGEDFDYKSNLRDEKWVKELNKTISSNYQKQIDRDRIPSFESEWVKASSEKKLL